MDGIAAATHGQSPAVSLLAQSAEAMANVQSLHILAHMRTLPADNSEQIDPSWIGFQSKSGRSSVIRRSGA
jgi:hypothetical protein